MTELASKGSEGLAGTPAGSQPILLPVARAGVQRATQSHPHAGWLAMQRPRYAGAHQATSIP